MKRLNLSPTKGTCTYVSFKIHHRADSTQIPAEKDIVRELIFMEKHNFYIIKNTRCCNFFEKYFNNVHIVRIIYRKVRHLRTEAKSVFPQSNVWDLRDPLWLQRGTASRGPL